MEDDPKICCDCGCGDDAVDIRHMVMTKELAHQFLESEDGKKVFMAWLMYKRCEYGLARVMHKLGVPIEKDLQEEIVTFLWEIVMHKPPEDIVEEWEAAEALAKAQLQPITAADLEKMRPKGVC